MNNPAIQSISPIFICLGFPKCATTWIHRQLESHPEVACTITKEVNYWTKNYSKGIDWYINQFPRPEGGKIFAEVTPHYVNKTALSRIAKDLQDYPAKFMVCLRDPFERTFSHFNDVVRSGRVSNDLQTAISNVPEIIEQSLYAKNLEMFENFLPLDKLHIDFYENIQTDPIKFIQQLYKYIGVAENHVPESLENKINPGRAPSKFDVVLKRTEMSLKNIGLKREHLVKLGLWPYIDSMYRNLSRKRPVPEMTLEQREIISKYISDDVSRLKNIIGETPKTWCS